MHKKITYMILLSLLFWSSNELASQTIYMDPTVAAILSYNNNTLKKSQDDTNNKLGQIRTAQLAVAAQLEAANQLQQKIYKGLTEVSSLLNDAYSVKKIINNNKLLLEYSGQIVEFASDSPEFSVFAISETTEFKRRMLLLTTEVTTILTGGEFNMMNSGQRRQLIRNVEIETALLAGQAWHILFTMKRAKHIGFWRAINPFQGWIDTDKRIARDIINRSKFL